MIQTRHIGTQRWIFSRVVAAFFTFLSVLVIARFLWNFLFTEALWGVGELDVWDGYLLFFFTAMLFVHVTLCMETILEDYVHVPMVCFCLIWFLRFVCLVLGGAACLKIFSVMATI